MELTEIALLVIGLLLVTQKWFWTLALFLGVIASLFAMIASIFHFEILAALGFFILMVICIFILAVLSNPDL